MCVIFVKEDPLNVKEDPLNPLDPLNIGKIAWAEWRMSPIFLVLNFYFLTFLVFVDSN